MITADWDPIADYLIIRYSSSRQATLGKLRGKLRGILNLKPSTLNSLNIKLSQLKNTRNFHHLISCHLISYHATSNSFPLSLSLSLLPSFQHSIWARIPKNVAFPRLILAYSSYHFTYTHTYTHYPPLHSSIYAYIHSRIAGILVPDHTSSTPSICCTWMKITTTETHHLPFIRFILIRRIHIDRPKLTELQIHSKWKVIRSRRFAAIVWFVGLLFIFIFAFFLQKH